MSTAFPCPARTAAPAWPRLSSAPISISPTSPWNSPATCPAYARPLFLRIQTEIDITGTFKQKKGELVKEGFDPAALTDPIYFLDAETGRYEPLDAARHADIVTGRMKL